jgi:hypothetical protein
MSSDVTTVTDIVEVVEVVVGPHSVTEVIGLDSAGLVEVHDTNSTIIDVPEPVVDVIEIVTADLAGPPGPVGPAGVQGAQGVQGPQGEQGPFAPLFIQTFAIPALIWVIHHNLDTYPVTTTVDLNGDEIVGDVETPDRNTVVVIFAVPVAGTARLKA